jgi:CheY-like chemotaxis protein
MILVVDDDEDIRRNLVSALRFEGYYTKEAPNGQVAIDLLAALTPSEWPCLILLDLMMPVMDGVRFLKVVNQEHREWLKIPIIVNTAKGSMTMPNENLPGAIDRIQKPVDLDSLYEVIERYATPECKDAANHGLDCPND